MRILIALHRIGPYHHARFRAAAQHIDLRVLETRPNSLEYPWIFHPEGSYPILRLHGQPHPEADPPIQLLDHQFNILLRQQQPDVVASVGWADRASQRLLIACRQLRIPLVIVSDSRQRDEPRSWPKEAAKNLLLRGYSAGLVAGKESRAYLVDLGFPPQAISQPWDVVDNALFAGAADLPQSCEKNGHFLCVSRLVAKKNHAVLIEAYSRYQQGGGRWGLKLVGSGPLEEVIRKMVSTLPHPGLVELQSFQQLEQLVPIYQQASAFVLASSTDQWGLVVNEAMAAGLPCLVSSACGCAADLIEHGKTGWHFDPLHPSAITALLHQVEVMPASERLAMRTAARACLHRYSPQQFAEGLIASASIALQRRRSSFLGAAAAKFLSRAKELHIWPSH